MLTPLKEINKNVKFFEEEHKYFIDNKELTSTTTVLGFFKNKFDPDGHIARAVAKRDNLTVEQVKNNWEQAKIDGCSRGTNFMNRRSLILRRGRF